MSKDPICIVIVTQGREKVRELLGEKKKYTFKIILALI